MSYELVPASSYESTTLIFYYVVITNEAIAPQSVDESGNLIF